MSLAVFSPGATLAWSVMRDVRFKSRTQTAVSGRKLFLLDQPFPIRTWTLTWEVLRDPWDTREASGHGYGYDERRAIEGFYMQTQGSFQPFLYEDLSDNYASGAAIGTGDGSSRVFQLARPFGGFNEPIIAPNNIDALYLAGDVAAPDTYAADPATGLVTFTMGNAPANGAAVTADFSYYFMVHFPDDTLSLENFQYQLWTLKQLKLEQLIP